MPAKIITFEGLDASFKETNSNRLADKLKDDGYDVHIFHFPAYDNPGCYFVKQFLQGSYKNSNIDDKPFSKSIFYTLDRFDTYTKYIKDIYDNGNDNTIIIFDRWTASNIFYQTSNTKDKFEDEASVIFAIEHEMYNLPVEDGIIYMDTPYKASIKIIEKRKSSDYIESNKEWIKSVFGNTDRSLALYEKLANLEFANDKKTFIVERVSTVDYAYNILSKDEIFEKVYKAALKILGG